MAQFVKVTADAQGGINAVAKTFDKESRKAIKKSVQEASKLVNKETKRQVKSSMKHYKSIISAARTKKVKVDQFSVSGGAHIMGNLKKGSREYVLRFFEKGTVERKTRKGYNRGKVKAYHFFANAVAITDNRVKAIFDKNMNKMR